MRIGFVVNDVKTEEASYTTIRLACEAINLGHEVWVMGVGDIAYDPDEKVHARAYSVPPKKYKNTEIFLRQLQGKNAVRERITVDDLDILMLRNVPSDDFIKRPWASTAAVEFGRVAMRHGVIVVNDPNGLAKAASKVYFELFPEAVRPRTLITRDHNEIKEFAKAEGGNIVLKPLQGSGGASVFLVKPDDVSNINQMIDAVSRDGFVIAQQYLPAAAEGDMRLFVMNGQAMRVKGKYCAFRRVRSGGDMRSNIHAGGTLAEAHVTKEALHIVEIVRPKLVQDGMFLVGLDVVGDKLMEINVFSPGGLGNAQKFTNINFTRHVIEALERKAAYMQFYGRNFNNVDLCTL